MAAPQCMTDDGNDAVFVGTMLETGDAFALCPQCWHDWLIVMLAGLTETDPAKIVAVVSDELPELRDPEAHDAEVEREDGPDAAGIIAEEHAGEAQATGDQNGGGGPRPHRRHGLTSERISELVEEGERDVGEPEAAETVEGDAG